jgi:phosphoserine phosphatase
MSQESQFKLAFFDMDGTVLNGRTIFNIADYFGLSLSIEKILISTLEPYEKSIKIAKLLKGLNQQNLLRIFQSILLQPYIEILLKKLRSRQIITILLSDSYQFLANDLQKRLNIDYAFANELVVKDNIVTGQLIISNGRLQKSSDGKIYSFCKAAFVDALSIYFDAKPSEILAIGDSFIDMDMIKNAGLGVAYRAPHEVSEAAHLAIDDFRALLSYL